MLYLVIYIQGRPEKTWEEVVRQDRVRLGMDSTDALDKINEDDDDRMMIQKVLPTDSYWE